MGLLFHDGFGVADHQTAEEVTALLYSRHPEWDVKFGPKGRKACADDVYNTLLYLATATATERYDLFREYLSWLRRLLAQINIAPRHLADMLVAMRDALAGRGMNPDSPELTFLDDGISDLASLGAETGSLPFAETHRADLASELFSLLHRGDRGTATTSVLNWAETLGVEGVYLDVIEPCLQEIGRRWHDNQLNVAEEHFMTASIQVVMARLYPLVFQASRIGRRLVAVCAEGELHEIGMRMVADLFDIGGWDTTFLGAGVPDTAVIRTIRDRGCDLLAISASLAINVPAVTRLVSALRLDPQCSHVKVMVGGRAFNQSPDLWRRTGADGWAGGGREALRTGNRLFEATAEPVS
ncbi:putative cobalamin binding protein [Paramagnetospirillum magnetotacticum MS-1]|uniref:Putative cobalamin binding protein n=1 Tax=Paramagnetospirillum magnetotacticum MS-1 TaxID=272627 RepID=A0A0C2Z102_PARME|nr:cobalamin-dependent protein [Paramagnetospirillum magnetotacticum]KIM00576.1 putative cobalamin binding protein [Paramagnetospirillum magnetotacticum MS-1]